MSQRANACHCPEVTIELNHFSLTTPAGTKPRDPAANPSSDVCTQCFGERPQKRPDLTYDRLRSRTELPEPSACSGCWATTGLHGVKPHVAVATVLVCRRHGGGPVLCPAGRSDPSPTAWVQQSYGSALLLGPGPMRLQVGLGFEHLPLLALHLETPHELTEAVHVVTS